MKTFPRHEAAFVDALFAQTISRSRQMLKGIGEEIPSDLPHGGAEARELDLAGFAKRYTMQSERDVHENITRAAVGTGPVPVRAEEPESPSGEADELGDNVEFF